MNRGIVLYSLAVIGVAGALHTLRRPLSMSAPACLDAQWDRCLGTENGIVFMTLAGLPSAILLAAILTLLRRHPLPWWRPGGRPSPPATEPSSAPTPARRSASPSLTDHASHASPVVPALRPAASAWRRSLAEVGMVYGTVPMVALTMMPGPGAGVVPGRVSLIPLADLIGMGAAGIIANLLIFAAPGFFAPIRFAALASVPRILALGAACSVLIETLQYALQLDRVSSIDDVLLNAAGAALAGLASRRWWRAVEGQPDPAPALIG